MTHQPTIDGLVNEHQQQLTSDDHYTPKWVFDRLGLEFDIDVASPPGGISWIPAKSHFTMADDGLAQPWHGRVWMNPPYSNSKPWVHRWLEHGNGLALLPIVKSRWLIDLWNDSRTKFVVVYEPGTDRILFHHNGKLKPIMFAVGLWAIGAENIEALERLSTPR